MRVSLPPTSASWSHHDSRAGFEVAFFSREHSRHRIIGHTTAVEALSPWSVSYEVSVDDSWATRVVRASNVSLNGRHDLLLLRDAHGTWSADNENRPDLDGCIDVDFESSAVTNTLPIHRLDFARDTSLNVPAAFIRADDLRVERLDQLYTLTDQDAQGFTFHYQSPTFGFACELRYDRAGLIVDYPGIATRYS